MNSFIYEDRDTSSLVHVFVIRMVANNMKIDFMARSYACARYDMKSVKLNGFLGSKILKSNCIIAVANQTLKPTPGLLTQEVSRFCNQRHIGTGMMQSFIFPPDIIHEIKRTHSALYTSIKAVLKLMH